MATLIDAIQTECTNLREKVLPEYDKLPNNAGSIAAILMRQSIKKAEAAIASGEAVEMVMALNDLRGYSL